MKIEVKNNAVEITTTIPLMESTEIIRSEGKALDIIGSFSAYLTLLLKRRGEACMRLLRNHINDVFSNDGFTIAWHRKDGTVGYFCILGYGNIQRAIETLQHGRYKEFLESGPMVDQAIKAIMNEPELDHADAGSFKFSELVSVLCEAHAFNNKVALRLDMTIVVQSPFSAAFGVSNNTPAANVFLRRPVMVKVGLSLIGVGFGNKKSAQSKTCSTLVQYCKISQERDRVRDLTNEPPIAASL